MIKIAPSLLSADLARLADAVASIADAVDYVHCDVMDGHFVPNLTFGAPVVKWLKSASPLPLDVHLMIENPARWVDDYIRAGLAEDDYLTFHWEAAGEGSGELLDYIRSRGVRAGVSIKPNTPFDRILPIIDRADQILIMTVEPGFGGQSFIRDMVAKISAAASAAGPKTIVAVDGGIDPITAPEAVRAGARLLVAGSAIFGSPDPHRAAVKLRQSAERFSSEKQGG